MPPPRVVTVITEMLGHQRGLWCLLCLRATAVRAYVVVRTDSGMSMLVRDQCLECGSHQVAS